ncbi:MAG: hypothetical protein ACLRXC_04650 [[Clostridium] leptum]
MPDMAGEVGHMRLAEDGPVGFGKSGSLKALQRRRIAQLARKAVEAIQNGFHPLIALQ